MAAPHVAGAWAALKQAAPGASVDTVLAALQQSGKPITDFRNGVIKPRIRLLGALARLLPERPFLETVTPSSGGLGQQLTVTVTGLNFGSGTSVSFGAGVTVEQTSTVSATELTATVVIAEDADSRCSRRDGGERLRGERNLVGRVPGHAPAAVVVVALRGQAARPGREGQTGCPPADGALDATFKVTVEPGSGARTVTQLELWRSPAAAAGTRSRPAPPGSSAPQQGSTARSSTPATEASASPPATDKASTCSPATPPKPLHPRRPNPAPRRHGRRLKHNRRHDPQRTTDSERRQPAAGAPRTDAERDRDREQLPERRNRQLWRRHKRHRDQRRLPDKPDRHRRDRRQRDAFGAARRHRQQPRRSQRHTRRRLHHHPAAASLSLRYEGKLRDRVGKGNGMPPPTAPSTRPSRSPSSPAAAPAPSPSSSSRRSPAAAAGTRSRPAPPGSSAPQQDSTARSSTPATEASASPPATDKASTCSPATPPQANSPPAPKSGSAPSWPTAQAQPPTRPSAHHRQ